MSLESPEPRRAPKRWSIALLVLALALIVVPAAGASQVIVQGTTDIRDAGLLEEVIEPGFHAAYPQFEIKYVPVGTGQALTNAKAGQGDAVVTHAPSLEKTFVEEGYSLELRGRQIFYSDYVIVGPTADPAGAAATSPNNAAATFEAIARAGAEGKANFVSRGDNSGTNTEEKTIWKLTGVELNKLGEPGKAGTEEDASWYHRANLGQAETVQLANQCPEATFEGGNCYDITDRGTFNRLVANGAVTALKVVAEKNEATAPGGPNLLTNPFDVYVVNPAKVTGVTLNVEGAEALVQYLTSEAFQAALASFPNTTAPAFFADAHPKLAASPTLSGTVDEGAGVSVAGNVTNLLPGSSPVAGVPIVLRETVSADPELLPIFTTLASGVTGADGSYLLTAGVTHGGRFRVEMPTTTTYPPFTASPLIDVGALTQTFAEVGQLAVRPKPAPIARPKIVLRRPRVKGRIVTLRGLVKSVAGRDSEARLVALGRKQGQRKLHALHTRRAPKGSGYTLHVKLDPGKWKLRVRYRDPGTVLPATSRAVLGLCALTAALLALPGSPASGAVAGGPAVVVNGPGGAQMVFDGEEVESAYDVAPHTATLRGNAGEAGESTGVPKSLSAEGLIALAGGEPAATGYITVPRPNGTVAYLRLAELPVPPEGPASFWVDSGCIRFFRPAIGDGPNAEDNIASCGAPLAVGVRDGAILTVRATPSSSTATAGQAIEFTATAEGGEGGEGFSYVWDFGDGSTAEGPRVGHAFAATGSYRVRVTATGNEESGGESAPVTIVVGSPPAGAGVGAGPEAPKKKTKPHGTGGHKRKSGGGGAKGNGGAKGGNGGDGAKDGNGGKSGAGAKGAGTGNGRAGGADEPSSTGEESPAEGSIPATEPAPESFPIPEPLPSEPSPFGEAPLPALPEPATPPTPAEATAPPAAEQAVPTEPQSADAPAPGQTVRGQLVADRFEAGAPASGAGGSSADRVRQSFASAPPASGDSIPVTALIAAVLLAGGVLFEWRRRPGRGFR